MLNRTARALLDRRLVTDHYIDVLGVQVQASETGVKPEEHGLNVTRSMHEVGVEPDLQVQASATGVEPDRACLIGP